VPKGFCVELGIGSDSGQPAGQTGGRTVRRAGGLYRSGGDGEVEVAATLLRESTYAQHPGRRMPIWPWATGPQ